MNGQSTPRVMSQSEELINRINQKIDGLFEILSSVIVIKEQPEVAEKTQRGLVSDLNNLEGRISTLLDSIVI